jgi:hypothetical protein
MAAVVKADWVDQHGTSYRKQVSLEPVLREATGRAREALVLEIGPAGKVTVHREYSGDHAG